MNKTAGNSRKILTPKVYFLSILVLGLVIIFDIVSLINVLDTQKYLSKSATPNPVIPTPAKKREIIKEEGTIKIILEENQKIVSKKNLNAKIIFNSPHQPIGGMDVILNFDPKIVSVVDISENKKIFRQIITNTQKQKEGEIKITAYQPTGVLMGEETLASLTFQLLKETPTSIKIKFLGPEVVTDSNLVSQTTQKDILREVENLNLNL